MSASVEEEEVQMRQTDEEALQRAYEAKLGSLYAKAAKIESKFSDIKRDVDALLSPDESVLQLESIVEQSLLSKASSMKRDPPAVKEFDYSDWSSRSII